MFNALFDTVTTTTTTTTTGAPTTTTTTTTAAPITATPTTSVGTVTANTVNFNISNNDAATASITWQIRVGSETGSVIASNTVSVASGATIQASASGLSTGQTYWLTGVFATASGKQISAEATRRSATTTTTTTTTTAAPQTAAPSFSNISSTTNSISFRANNNDSSSVTMSVTNNTTGQFLFNGTVAGNSFTSITNSGLSSSTTYTYQITVQASGKTSNNITQNISTQASSPPPSTNPPSGPTTTTTTTAAPTTTTTAAPTTTTTTTQFGCLDVNTPIYMFDGSIKLLKDIQVGDELLGYYIDGMLDESNPYWQNWYAPLSAEGNFEKAVVTGVTPSSYHQYFIINNDIRITKAHPMFVNQLGTDTWNWIDTPHIQVGDKLKGLDGSIIEVQSYAVVNDFIEVVTLDVENIDNYFAGQTPVLVHNNIVKE